MASILDIFCAGNSGQGARLASSPALANAGVSSAAAAIR
jgi:hypothetical protein